MNENELGTAVHDFAFELGITGWRIESLRDSVREILEELDLYVSEEEETAATDTHTMLKKIEHDAHSTVQLFTPRGVFFGRLIQLPQNLWVVSDQIASLKADFVIKFKENAVKHIDFPRRLIVIGD